MFDCSHGGIDDTVGLTRFDGIAVDGSQISLISQLSRMTKCLIGKIYKMIVLSVIKITITQVLRC